ncbi:MAG: hypothetical protein HY240_06610 [Actinobacteria bacterium]|nr:hypothetical protein [Actinomycetota bacterium]
MSRSAGLGGPPPARARRALALGVAALIVTGCARGGPSPSPSPTPTGATASSSVAPVSPVSPSPPTPTCTRSLSDYRVRFQRGPGVAASDERDARSGTRLALTSFDTRIPRCDYWRVVVKLLARTGPGAVAATRPDPPNFTIDVYTRSPGWAGAPPGQRLITMLHEWYHVVEFSEFAYCACTQTAPNWLIEGAAVYESYREAARLHRVDYASLRLRDVYFAGRDGRPLAALAHGHLETNDYSVAFLAVEDLVRRAGEGSLKRFWLGYQSRGKVPAAFQEAFGVRIDRFYAAFAAYRARGYR